MSMEEHMGQQAAAIMVGIIPDKALWKRLRNKDGEAIWDHLSYSLHPDCGEDFDCIGFAATLSNGADRGEGELRKSVALAGFRVRLSEGHREGEGERFSKWMHDTQGVELPSPTILIAVVERA